MARFIPRGNVRGPLAESVRPAPRFELQGFLSAQGFESLGTIVTPDYSPFAHCDERGKRAWLLFCEWLGGEPAWYHVEWLLQRQFKTPDEWMGEEGAKFRRQCGMRETPTKTIKHWQAFFAKHEGKSLSDIEALLAKGTSL